MKTIKKSVLKKGYYYEEKPWYDTLPENLIIPSYKEEIFPKDMTHQEILDVYKIVPYTIEQAFAVAAVKTETLKNGEYRIIYFIDGNIRYRLNVYRDSDGNVGVNVLEVFLGNLWLAGYGVLFSNEPLETDNAALGNFDTLPLTDEQAIAHLKKRGFTITRMEWKEY